MEFEKINVGARDNDGTGDPLRVAHQKLNRNVDRVVEALGDKATAYDIAQALNPYAKVIDVEAQEARVDGIVEALDGKVSQDAYDAEVGSVLAAAASATQAAQDAADEASAVAASLDQVDNTSDLTKSQPGNVVGNKLHIASPLASDLPIGTPDFWLRRSRDVPKDSRYWDPVDQTAALIDLLTNSNVPTIPAGEYVLNSPIPFIDISARQYDLQISPRARANAPLVGAQAILNIGARQTATPVALTQQALKETVVFYPASTAGFVVDGLCRLISRKRFTPYRAPALANKTIGELYLVREIRNDGGIEVDRPLSYDFLISDFPRAVPLGTAHDLRIDGLLGVGRERYLNGGSEAVAQMLGLQLSNCVGYIINAPKLSECSSGAISLTDCVDGKLYSGRARIRKNAPLGYGLTFGGASRGNTVRDFDFYYHRHAATAGSASATYNVVTGLYGGHDFQGQPRDNVFIDCVHLGGNRTIPTPPATVGGGGDGWDTHSDIYSIKWIRCQSINATGFGFNIECPVAELIDCEVRNSVSYAVNYNNATAFDGYLKIDGLKISGCTFGIFANEASKVTVTAANDKNSPGIPATNPITPDAARYEVVAGDYYHTGRVSRVDIKGVEAERFTKSLFYWVSTDPNSKVDISLSDIHADASATDINLVGLFLATNFRTLSRRNIVVNDIGRNTIDAAIAAGTTAVPAVTTPAWNITLGASSTVLGDSGEFTYTPAAKTNTSLISITSSTPGVEIKGTPLAIGGNLSADNTSNAVYFGDANIAKASVGAIRGNASKLLSNPFGSNVKISGADQVFVFTSSGTFSVPQTDREVQIFAMGAGGGGGSGRRGPAGSVRAGGGAGGAGAFTSGAFTVADLPATLTITIGAGGPGGAAVTTDNTVGLGGGTGGQTTVANGGASLLTAPGGGGGGAGSTNPGTAGTAGQGQSPMSVGAGGLGSVGAAAGSDGSVGLEGSGGGGGGGGISTGETAFGGGTGAIGYNKGGVSRRAAAAPGGAIGAAGTAGNSKTWQRGAGSGGGGGGAGAADGSSPGGAGGAGGGPGGGGGGGGGSTNGQNSGAGGAGANGEVWIVLKARGLT